MLLLDEPVNGLDPEGILWIRNLLKSLAAEGRTVFVSSHLMSEMAVTATELIVVGRGKLIVVRQRRRRDPRAPPAARCWCAPSEAERLAALLAGRGRGRSSGSGRTRCRSAGSDSAAIGLVAAQAAIALIELTPQQATLEEAFMEITRDAVEFHGSGSDSATPAVRRTAGGAR